MSCSAWSKTTSLPSSTHSAARGFGSSLPDWWNHRNDDANMKRTGKGKRKIDWNRADAMSDAERHAAAGSRAPCSPSQCHPPRAEALTRAVRGHVKAAPEAGHQDAYDGRKHRQHRLGSDDYLLVPTRLLIEPMIGHRIGSGHIDRGQKLVVAASRKDEHVVARPTPKLVGASARDDPP
jgi:hypothetical protein